MLKEKSQPRSPEHSDGARKDAVLPNQQGPSGPLEQLAQRMNSGVGAAKLAQTSEAVQRRAHQHGLPQRLQNGIEALSGMSMDHVRVHRNSSKPAQLNALAFAQGNDIHLSAGQEQYLPHEAWHVVQQAQGRVRPTKQLQSGTQINDNAGLEREADVMGGRAMTSQFAAVRTMPLDQILRAPVQLQSLQMPVQRVINGLPQFVIHTPAPLSAPALARLNGVAATLAAALNADLNAQIWQLIISVEAEGGANYLGGVSTIAGDNPAETTTNQGPNGDTIRVTLQRPFAEAATEGELLGMLAHEVGAHNVPSDFRGIADNAVTVFLPVHTARKTQKNNTPTGGYEFQNWPGPAHGGWHGSRQHDHVMLADTLRNPPVFGAAMPLTRANVYFETVLNIGDQIWTDVALTPRQKSIQVNDLIHLYIFDIARVIASDDGRMPAQQHGLALNDIYSEVFNQVVLPYQPGHAWIPNTRPKGNPFSLAASLVAFIAKVKLEKYRNG